MRLWMNWVSHGSAQASVTEELQVIRDEMRWNPAPQQHSKSHGYGSAADLGRKTSCTHAAATVFTRSHTLWLLALFGLKMGLQGQCFATLKDTKCIATGGLHAILKKAFYECFQICHTITASVCECVCTHTHAGCTSKAIRLKSTVLQVLKYDN